jgi:hypothetical protein
MGKRVTQSKNVTKNLWSYGLNTVIRRNKSTNLLGVCSRVAEKHVTHYSPTPPCFVPSFGRKVLVHSTTPTPPPAESSSRRRRSTKKKLGDRAIQISKPQAVTQSHHQPYMVLDFAIILVDFLKQPLAPRLFSMFLAKSR